MKVLFGEYLDERNYFEEAAFMFMAANALEQSQESFLKALNVEMTLAVGQQRNLSAEEMTKLREELVDRLKSAIRFEDAGDLIDPQADFEGAFDCYVRANTFQKAIKVCTETKNLEKITSVIKPALLIALDLKANQLRSVIDVFGKRILRL